MLLLRVHRFQGGKCHLQWCEECSSATGTDRGNFLLHGSDVRHLLQGNHPFSGVVKGNDTGIVFFRKHFQGAAGRFPGHLNPGKTIHAVQHGAGLVNHQNQGCIWHVHPVAHLDIHRQHALQECSAVSAKRITAVPAQHAQSSAKLAYAPFQSALLRFIDTVMIHIVQYHGLIPLIVLHTFRHLRGKDPADMHA